MENEKRLIDANAFIKEHCSGCKYFDVNGICTIDNPVCGSVMIVTELPTIDAVEVVRCKDCKFWADGLPGCTEHVKCCKIGFYMVGENGYCVFGERRDGE